LRVLVTGFAGFIGYHVSKALLDQGHVVFGVDNFSPYYDPRLKAARAMKLLPYSNWDHWRCDITKPEDLLLAFRSFKPDVVCHLAAAAGVRYSVSNPWDFISSNMVGFQSVLETIRGMSSPAKLVYASSSSVYGGMPLPSQESQPCTSPVSLYAATKLSNELVATVYHQMFGLSVVGLRFFTVYGPLGRPDMAMWLFTHAIRQGRPLKLFGQGKLLRDMTFISDIVSGVIAAINLPGFHNLVLNLGRGEQVVVEDMVKMLESRIGKPAIIERVGKQQGDIDASLADVSLAEKILDYHPKVSIREGINLFINWVDQYSFFDEVSDYRPF
jgi:UDP-glucuronate 4-epimerase